MAHQAVANGDATIQRDSLKRRGEREPDPRRRVGLRHRDEFRLGIGRKGLAGVIDQEPDRPTSLVLAFGGKLVQEDRGGEAADGMKRPQGPKSNLLPTVPTEQGLKSCPSRVEIAAARGAFLQEPTRLPGVPVVLLGLQIHKLIVSETREIALRGLWRSIRHAIDPPVLAMGPSASSSWHSPVSDQSMTNTRAVRAGLEGEAAEPGVVGEQEILGVPGHVARSRAFQGVAIQAVAMNVARQDRPAIRLGPVIAEIDHRPGMRVPAAGLAVLADASARVLPGSARPVDVIGAAFQQLIRIGVDVASEHPLKMSAGTT